MHGTSSQCFIFYGYAITILYILSAVSPSGSVSTSPRALLTAASDSVSIKCFAEGGPGNSFLWRHNGTVLAKSTNSILNVTVFTTEHLGNYSCTVTNIAGHDSSTSIIHGNLPTCTRFKCCHFTTMPTTYSYICPFSKLPFNIFHHALQFLLRIPVYCCIAM